MSQNMFISLLMFCRQYYRRKESTPRKMTRGRCSHRHNNISSTSHLSNSNTSLTNTVRSSTRSHSSDKVTSVTKEQEINMMFLVSRTSNKLLDNIDLEMRESEEVMGQIETSVDDSKYRLIIHQEVLSRKHQQTSVGNMNMVVMVYSDMNELQELLSFETGLLGYISQYWRGYLPLLLVQVASPGDLIKKNVIDLLEKDFSSCYRLHLQDPGSYNGFLLENCVRFYLHNEKFQCNKVERTTSTSTNQSLVSNQWKCSGLCGLKSFKPDPLRKKKRSVINAIRRKISRNEA